MILMSWKTFTIYLGYGVPSGPGQSVPWSASPHAYFNLGPQSAITQEMSACNSLKKYYKYIKYTYLVIGL